MTRCARCVGRDAGANQVQAYHTAPSRGPDLNRAPTRPGCTTVPRLICVWSCHQTLRDWPHRTQRDQPWRGSTCSGAISNTAGLSPALIALSSGLVGAARGAQACSSVAWRCLSGLACSHRNFSHPLPQVLFYSSPSGSQRCFSWLLVLRRLCLLRSATIGVWLAVTAGDERLRRSILRNSLSNPP